MLQLKLLLLLVCSFVTLSFSQDPTADQFQNYRLPSNVLPSRYSLWILIDLAEVSFSGNVTIAVRVTEPTFLISLNYKDLTVDWNGVNLRTSNGNRAFTLQSQELRTLDEIAVLRFTEQLPAGDYLISLSFGAPMRSDLRGLYMSSYRYSDGTTRYLAATQMQPLYARMVFPCFDEPAMKATFQINIYHETRFDALSNMPIAQRVESSIKPGFDVTEFQETISMSTYLIAFTVTLDYAAYTEIGPISIYASMHELHRTQYAYHLGTTALNLLKDFLDADYQLPKLDMINIPDLSFEAMENWGIITFREPFLFRDNDTSIIDVRDQQIGSLIITHELVHMWFGNEVTPEYWTYTWLSEGFARFFEFFITDQIETSWRLMDQFVVTNVHSAFSFDDKLTVRAMTTPVGEPSFINGMFDYIVYAKSGSVLRMFQHVLGVSTFQKALRNYINDRSHTSTNPDYLFAAFQAAANADNTALPASFKAIFETWSNNPGFPVVTVERASNQIRFSQKRFLINIADYPPQPEPKLYIPLSWTTSDNINFDNTTASHWLHPDTEILTVDIEISSNAWILVNTQVTGFYRVNYERSNWNLLSAALERDDFGQINVLNRAQLIDDAVNLAKARQLEFDIAFDVLAYLRRETDYVPWAAAANTIPYLSRNLRGHQYFGYFETFVKNITALAYKEVKVTIVEEQHLMRMHRLNVASIACLAGLEECVSDMEALIDTGVPEEIRDFVYCASARYSIESARKLLTRVVDLITGPNRQNEATEINRIFNGLGCSGNEDFVKSVLSLTITPGTLQGSERNYIFRSIVTGSYNGTKYGLIFLKENFAEIGNFYESVLNIFEKEFAEAVVSDEHMSLFADFYEENNEQLSLDIRDACNAFLIITYENLVWRNSHADTIGQWLYDNVHDSGALIKFNIMMLFLVLLNVLKWI